VLKISIFIITDIFDNICHLLEFYVNYIVKRYLAILIPVYEFFTEFGDLRCHPTDGQVPAVGRVPPVEEHWRTAGSA
jgi:hypothetical protein